MGHPLLYKHRPETSPGKSGPKWVSSSSETANKTLSITPHVVLQAEVSLIGQSRAAMESSEAVFVLQVGLETKEREKMYQS